MTLTSLFILIYIALSLLLTATDIRQGLLPDALTCPLLWSGMLWHLLCQPQKLDAAVWGAIAGYAGFALVYWSYRAIRQREGLGYGDIKFLAALGAWHGWHNLPWLISLSSILACAFIAVCRLRCDKWQAIKNPLPFGPFMAAAGLIVGWQTFGLSTIYLQL